MNRLIAAACFALLLPCRAGAVESRPAPPVAVMGIVPAPVPEELRAYVEMQPGEGIFIKGVVPGGPADQAGLKEADIVLAIDGARILSREGYRRITAGKKAGDTLKLTCLRAGRTVEISVVLKPREQVLPGGSAMRSHQAASAPSPLIARRSLAAVFDPANARRQAYMRRIGTQGMRPLELRPEIVAAIRETRGVIIGELAQEPEQVDSTRLTRLMQRLRDLARDANASRPDWMVGKAGEATLQFRDGEGTIVLTGADNRIQIELLGPDGCTLYRGPFNTENDRRAVPANLHARFRALQELYPSPHSGE